MCIRDSNHIDREVTWSVNNDSNKSNLLSATTSRTGENSKITFTPNAPGTYVISATYSAITNKAHTVTKTITVGKPNVELQIHGKNQVSKLSQEHYWLSAQVEGESQTNLDVHWKWEHNQQWITDVGTSKSLESSLVTVDFKTDNTYRLSCLLYTSIVKESPSKIGNSNWNTNTSLYKSKTKLRTNLDKNISSKFDTLDRPNIIQMKLESVSYTHLDVYKRQELLCVCSTCHL